ncbi:MAG: transaldolase family protein, partial [Candidatus Binatia bacterium]
MPMHPLIRLQQLGQSPWHDNIHRRLLTSGQLAKMVEDGDITGLTSNPTIFEQAIAKSTDYDDDIRRGAREGKTPEEIFYGLAIRDLQGAADVLAPVFERTGGKDGYVSIEVSPKLAHDTQGTIREARNLWTAVGRPNLMVKIPATPAGIPAIEQSIADGLSINVTLIFSLKRYEEVMDAYLRGLIRRMEIGQKVDRVASVASFFVSRVD